MAKSLKNEPIEIWKDINDTYEVSDWARVRKKGTDKILEVLLDFRNKHLYVLIDKERAYLKDLVADAFIEGEGEPFHIDDNKLDCHVWNIKRKKST